MLNNQLTIDTITAPYTADTKSLTVKPFINIETNQKNTPFKTRANNPKVRRLIGRVMIFMIGLITECRIVNKIPALIAVTTPSIKIPVIKYADANTANVKTINLRAIFIVLLIVLLV